MKTSHNKPSDDIAVYESEDGKISFNVNVFEETVWLTQDNIAMLFGVQRPAITKHLKNIFKSGELKKNSVGSTMELTANDGKKYNTKIYNLDAIIAVGYRVNSKRATEFRQWATKVLKQYLLNGYAINERRILEIKASIDDLVSSQKILRKDVDRLIQLVERPIIIQHHLHQNNNHQITNQIGIGQDLENRLVQLLGQVIAKMKDDKRSKKKLERIKKDALSKSSKSKKNLLTFFKEIGDDKSEIHQAVKGAGITKKVVLEIIKIGDKLIKLI